MSATYPNDIKAFVDFEDADPNIPGSGSDVDADAVNEIYDEIEAVESALGLRPAKLDFFTEDPDTTTGLTWGYLGCRIRCDNTVRDISAGTIALTDNATNYVEYDWLTNAVVKNVSAFTTGRYPIAVITTLSGVQQGTAASHDKRALIGLSNFFYGPVGINTLSPAAQLDVVHASGNGLHVTRNAKFLGLNGNYGSLDTHCVIQASSGMALAFCTNGDNEYMRLSAVGNLGLGVSAFDATGVKCLAIGNGTPPAAHLDNAIQVFSVDSSDAAATLGLFLEQAVEDIGTFTASHKLKIKINGTEYWLQLDAA